MKPHEETWEADEDMPDVRDGTGEYVLRALPPDAEDRARLAAAAPEMARLLVEFHGRAAQGRSYWCHFCGGQHATHSPDCRLVAVLRKAGVIEGGDDHG